MIKKLLSIKFILALALAAVLSGCGGGGGSAPPPPSGGSNWDSMNWDQDNWA